MKGDVNRYTGMTREVVLKQVKTCVSFFLVYLPGVYGNSRILFCQGSQTGSMMNLYRSFIGADFILLDLGILASDLLALLSFLLATLMSNNC